MDQYRAYRLDEQGRVCGVMVLDADGPEEVLAKAGGLERPFGMEVWLRDRCVAKLGGDGSTAGLPSARILAYSRSDIRER
ncbi:MAG: hypothetical protein JWO72_2398 [Caulobacteraceae bacterium]|nr:hypothetical protein [Caulobacteraceae bacterium]